MDQWESDGERSSRAPAIVKKSKLSIRLHQYEIKEYFRV